MDKKEVQRQRMMTYFIDAAKKIIKVEGVKNLTVRKVGDRAGYSYATIYNYFNDLNTLLFYCLFDFLEDCYQYLISIKNDELDCKEQLITYACEYFKYFAQRPDEFMLIFVEDLGNSPDELIRNITKPSVSLLFHQSLEECVKGGYITADRVELMGELLASSLHGKLLFFIKRRNRDDLEVVVENVKNEIEFLLNMGDENK